MAFAHILTIRAKGNVKLVIPVLPVVTYCRVQGLGKWHPATHSVNPPIGACPPYFNKTCNAAAQPLGTQTTNNNVLHPDHSHLLLHQSRHKHIFFSDTITLQVLAPRRILSVEVLEPLVDREAPEEHRPAFLGRGEDEPGRGEVFRKKLCWQMTSRPGGRGRSVRRCCRDHGGGVCYVYARSLVG